MKGFISNIRTALIGAVFPNRCLVCSELFSRVPDSGEDIPEDEEPVNSSYGISLSSDVRSYLGLYVCPSCSSQFLPVESPICSQCGLMFGGRDGEDHLCGDCIRHPKRYRKARALCVYERTGLELIHALKYRGKIQLGKPLGALLHATFAVHWTEGEIDTVIPVPLHKRRLRERGFNQAFLLLGNWPGLRPALPLDDDGMSMIHLDRESLVRERRTAPQTGSGREERMANVKNVFAVWDRRKITGRKILLIDDVYTTGATVEACAGALLGNGAEYVDVLTLARAM